MSALLFDMICTHYVFFLAFIFDQILDVIFLLYIHKCKIVFTVIPPTPNIVYMEIWIPCTMLRNFQAAS
jgi:hypothetical protein